MHANVRGADGLLSSSMAPDAAHKSPLVGRVSENAKNQKVSVHDAVARST
jgi:hypothetical protein